MAFFYIGSQIACLSDSGLDSRHFRSLLNTSHCNKRYWYACAIKINLAHAQVVVCYCLCNKPIQSIIATFHIIQINGSCDQTFKIDLFLVQVLRSCNHARACNSWNCVYMVIHTHVCMPRHTSLYVCVVLCVFHNKPQVCHTWVFCVYTFCVCLSWGWLES